MLVVPEVELRTSEDHNNLWGSVLKVDDVMRQALEESTGPRIVTTTTLKIVVGYP